MRKLLLINLLFINSILSFAQSNIDGTVIDENGEPLIGVTVFINKTTFGTTTDLNGYYKLTT